MSGRRITSWRLRELSINRKLFLAVAVGSAASALVTGGILFFLVAFDLRAQFRDNVVSMTEVAAACLAAPRDAAGHEAAGDALAGLRAHPDVSGAALLAASGEVLARFGEPIVPPATADMRGDASFSGWQLRVSRPVRAPGPGAGVLLVTADCGRVMLSGLNSLSLAVLSVLVVGVGVAIATTVGFRDLIIGPVQRLAHVARRVAEDRDYSLRAPILARDEVGLLTATFNDMLSRIQVADENLRDAYQRVEREGAERARLQDHLVKASRVAGMAEVATSVLHNVGNVLNTVNLSVHHVRERLEESRLRHLRQAVGLLGGQNGNLANFLEHDTRGRALPGFLVRMTDHLDAENRELRAEMATLIGHVEHIKEIVSTQQSYARVMDVTERLAPAGLVEDALRLAGGSLERHRIRVVRDFQAGPDALADRHKVVQILVNLLANAKDAIKQAGRDDGRIAVRVAPAGSGHVAIAVEDNGTGIDAAILPKIFRHGFTTKPGGHGFGLHLSALAAQEMRGSLRVSSEGPGHGSVFTLILPFAPDPSLPT